MAATIAPESSPFARPSSMASGTGFLDLPVELQDEIVSFCTSYTDLKALCLTSRTVHALTVPKLYKSIVLTVDDLSEDLRESLNSANVGLRSTREVRILRTNTEYSPKIEGLHLLHLLQSLAVDSLDMFHFDIDDSIGEDVEDLLLKNQRRLRNITIYSEYNIPRTSPLFPVACPGNIASLKINIEYEEILKLAQYLLEHLPRLKQVYIRATDEFIFPSSSIFESWNTQHTTKPKLQLDMLSFDNVEFDERGAADLSAAIDVAHLGSLSFALCDGTDEVLCLCAASGSSLHSYINYNPSGASRDFVRSHDASLSALKGLRHIRMIAEDIYHPLVAYWDTCCPRGPNLRSLFIDTCGYIYELLDERNIELQHFAELCADCPGLEQLAVEAPALESDSFTYFLHALKSLTQLISLRILTRLWVPDEVSSLPTSNKMQWVKAQERELASRIFQELRTSCPNLRVIMFSGRCPSRRAYMRGICVDAFNQITAMAQPIPLSMVRHHEPKSEIFYNHDRDECV